MANGSGRLSGSRLVLVVCFAQIAAQIGAYVWVTLLERLRADWGIGPAEAGTITGAFYLAYMCAAPVLVSLTDRVDPKRIYVLGAALIAIGHLGFAYLVDGFWGALAVRAIAGAGWAGVYMTGLKLLADHVDAGLMRRAVAWHAAGIGIAGAVSFLFADRIANVGGWRAAFESAGWIAIVSLGLVLLAAPSSKPSRSGANGRLLDFRPVLRNRQAMAYAVTYCMHTWEMNVLRGWVVAFLGYVAARSPDVVSGWVGPAAAATGVALIGTGVSVMGNELSIRIGRTRIVSFATLASATAAVLLGVAGPLAYSLALVLSVLAGAAIWLDSSTLTGGTSEAAAPGQRGQTLALHTTLGYGGGAAGPVVMGLILATFSGADGYTHLAWALGFLHVAILGLLTRAWFVGWVSR